MKTKPPCPATATEVSFILLWSISAFTPLWFCSPAQPGSCSAETSPAVPGQGGQRGALQPPLLYVTQNADLAALLVGRGRIHSSIYRKPQIAIPPLEDSLGIFALPGIEGGRNLCHGSTKGIPKECSKSHFKNTRGRELLCQCRTPGSERSIHTFPAWAQTGLTAGSGVLTSAGTGCSIQPSQVICQPYSAFQEHLHHPLHGRNMQCRWHSKWR